MSTVHFVLQGKGGVGKSYAAVLLAQYLRQRGLPVSCFDGDPLNQTLGGFASLDVKKVDFLENTEKGRRINPRRFDDLVEQIANQPAGVTSLLIRARVRSWPWSIIWSPMKR
jgi:cellulose biosynthesis protein BcsQ